MRFLLIAAATSVLALFAATATWAAPDVAGTTVVNEDNGFPPTCNQPCFSIEKSFEVYLDGNPTAPGVCPAGNNTYVYTFTHIGGSGPFVPDVTSFELGVPNAAANVTSAGFIPGPLDPSAVTINTTLDVVTWDFNAPRVANGLTSSPLFLCSPLGPGGSGDTMISFDGQLSLDAPGTCVGPVPGEACDLEIDKTCCVPQPALPDLDICEGDMVRLIMEYTNDKGSKSNNEQGKKFKCHGRHRPGSPADIQILTYGSTVQATPSDDIVTGDTVEFTSSTGTLPDKLYFKTVGSWWWKKQYLKIDTSCDRAISCGDQFGAFKVVGVESTEGGYVDCNGPPPLTCTTNGDPAGTPCDAKLVDMVLEYNGQDCQDPLANPQNGEAHCDGDATGATDVGIVYASKFGSGVQISPASNVNDGDRVRVTSTRHGGLFPNVKFLVTDESGVRQKVEFHVSCSQPLALGDEFGSFKLVEFTTKNGTTVALGSGGDGTADACEVPLAPPGPHCTDDLEELTLVYIGDLLGEGCTVSNGQFGYASCSGADDPGDPVSVVAGPGLTIDPNIDLEFGDTISVTPSSGSVLPTFTSLSTTGAGGQQDITFKSSCHKPLSLGDRFGSWVVFGMDRKDDGAISLGGKVLYQYKVTNPNASQVDNVKVTDSELGDIVTGESIAAGDTETYTAMSTLFGTTTNVATVMGDVGGQACDVASDEVTVTVDVPPQGSFSCSEPITELTMIWDGAQTVDVKAWSGAAGSSTLLAIFEDIQPGDAITVDGLGASNPVWEIFDQTGTTKLGESSFDLWCQDKDMNGINDCGKREGNLKTDEPGLINDWLLEGMVDDDETLECTPGAIAVPPACGIGPVLALVMPLLMWWHRRRLRQEG